MTRQGAVPLALGFLTVLGASLADLAPLAEAASPPGGHGHGGHGHFPRPFPFPGPYPYPVPVPIFVPSAVVAPSMLVGPIGSGIVNPYPPGVGPVGPPMAPAPAVARPARRRDPERAAEVMTFGDRVFRHKNFVRATERYEQAVQADPTSAAPRVRLAQVAIRRGRYAEAADRFREAQAVEPGWLATAPDIQALFGEPAEFARQIAAIEAHLQANPNDRDAWLVLGAELYLSGRTQRAADIFLRLTDRKPDEMLAAFLAATRADERVRK
jgi:hypothetical protein